MPSVAAFTTAMLLSSVPPGYPAPQPLPDTGAPRSPISARVNLNAGLSFGVDAVLGPSAGPVLLDAGASVGFAYAWRIGVTSLPFTFGSAQVAPFFNVASPAVLPLAGSFNGQAVSYFPTTIDGAAAGLRVRFGDDARWFILAPAWYFTGSQTYNTPPPVLAAMYGYLGSAPPLLEYGWRVRPGLGVAFRTAVPFVSIQLGN